MRLSAKEEIRLDDRRLDEKSHFTQTREPGKGPKEYSRGRVIILRKWTAGCHFSWDREKEGRRQGNYLYRGRQVVVDKRLRSRATRKKGTYPERGGLPIILT